jgi:hypothetical protein
MIRNGRAVLVTSAAEILELISDMGDVGHVGDIALAAGVSVPKRLHVQELPS